VSRQDTRGRLGEIRTYDRRQILQSAVRKTTPGPGTAPPGRPLFAPGSGPRRGTIGKPPTSRATRALLARPGALRRGAAGTRRGQRRTAGDLDLLPAWVGHPRPTRRTLGRGPPAIDPGPHDHSTAGPPAWAVRKPTAWAGGIMAAGKPGRNQCSSRPSSASNYWGTDRTGDCCRPRDQHRNSKSSSSVELES